MLNISILRMKCPEGGCNYLSKLFCSIFYISKNFCTWPSLQVLWGSQTQYWLRLQCESSTWESKMCLWATRSNVGTGPNSFFISLFLQYSCAFADSIGAYNSHSLALFTECQSWRLSLVEERNHFSLPSTKVSTPIMMLRQQVLKTVGGALEDRCSSSLPPGISSSSYISTSHQAIKHDTPAL